MIRLKRFISIRAVQYEKFGGPEVLHIKTRELLPLSSNDVRIRVEYSALNRADLLQREGKYPNQKSPLPLGLECAGYVESVSCENSSLVVGDRVMALLNGGGYAELVDVDSQFCMKVPETIPVSLDADVAPNYPGIRLARCCCSNSRNISDRIPTIALGRRSDYPKSDSYTRRGFWCRHECYTASCR